jgi:hypothetical protein
MTYGITFETANGNIQIDSDTTNTGLIVLSSAASSTTVTFDPQKELVFAKPASTTYTNQKVAVRYPTGYSWSGAGTFTFEEPDGTAVAMNYIVAKWSNEQTASSSGHGLQVYNSDGDLAFDSSLYTGNGGIGIIAVAAQQTLSGYGKYGTTSRMSTDTTKYYSMNGSYANGNNSMFLGLEFNKSTSTANGSGGVGVYWLSYFTAYSFDGGGFGSYTAYISNFTPRFIAEGGSV